MCELVIKTALGNGDLKMPKYFTKEELIKINNKSIKANRNRTFEPDSLDKLNASFFYPITFVLPHNDTEIRARVQLSDNEGDNGYLDMDMKEYMNLPNWKGGV